MNVIYIIPSIQNLDDLAAEKYSGGYHCELDLTLARDGDINVTITAPSDGELNLGDVNLNAGGDININIVEV